jgi:hypothetical protein
MPTYRIEDNLVVAESRRGSSCSPERSMKVLRSFEATSGPRGLLISSEQGYQAYPHFPPKNVPKGVAVSNHCYWTDDTFVMIGFAEIS